MTPHEVKFQLTAKLMSLARDGQMPVIVDIHSACVEDNMAFIIYDIAPDPDGDGLLHFTFPLPQLVSRADLRDFSAWLARPDVGETVH